MFLTSEQAREKMCPLLMQGVFAAPSDGEVTLREAKCRAEDCMAWRDIRYDEETGTNINPAGYCGLAGRPARQA